MENVNKRDLLQTINNQKDQLTRYESRLRDVVTAYKGLVKEKEALEASLKALSGSNVGQTSTKTDNASNKNTEHKTASTTPSETQEVEAIDPKCEETVEQLRIQLATLMNSLATLSAEKSRMEASFQADKKQLRMEKDEKVKNIKELQEKLQQMTRQHQSELDNGKSKLIVERHERGKEQNDHGIMIRELQKLLADERHNKEQLETHLEELKSKVTHLESQSGLREQFEKKLRDLRNELESARRKTRRAEAKSNEPPPLLLVLQEEMANMKMHHQTAILEEQRRAADAEDRARRLAAVHEERVANLEARLAELSETVGSYDRVRQQDQLSIQKLKEHIAQLDMEHCSLQQVYPTPSFSDQEEEPKNKSEADISLDVQSLVDKIVYLKGQLLLANQRSEKPIDINAILNLGTSIDTSSYYEEHRTWKEEYLQLQQDFDLYKQSVLQQNNSRTNEVSNGEYAALRTQVKNLKERVHILNAQLDDLERECRQKVDHHQKLLKEERTKYKAELMATETDYRCRLSLLEQQLQKQRDRTLLLLEEKEQEIRTLKSTFQMFLPGNTTKETSLAAEVANKDIGAEDVMSSLSQFGGVLRGMGPTGGGESPHMLHYAHEIARRDVEISNLRKTKHLKECALRELQRATVTEWDKHMEATDDLHEEVARLERCKSREGANLEYLKNVVLSFLLSNDLNSKGHMLNAISAVLKFSNLELEKVSRTYKSLIQPSPKT